MQPLNSLPHRAKSGIDRRRRAIVGALGAGVTALAGGATWAKDVRAIYSLGVFPFLPAVKIGERFAPAALDLGGALGAQIQLRTKDTTAAYSAELVAGTYEIVLVPPFLYVSGHDRQGYRALAQVDRKIRAVLVGREHLAGRRLADLRGETIAIVPLTAAAELLQAALLDEGLADGDGPLIQPHQTKVACLHAVTAGDAAGCAISSVLGQEPRALRKLDLVQIWESRPIGDLVLAVHPRVPAGDAERLRRHVIGWSDTREGQTILRGLSWPRVLGVDDSDFAGVRAISSRLHAGGSG